MCAVVSTCFIKARHSSKKIYFYDTFYNQDELLYDFSLNVGDTLKNVATYVTSGGPIKWSYILTNKDSVMLLDGKYYRRHIFTDISTSIGTYTVIESIGSNVGLLSPYFMNANGIDYMICYNKLFPYSTIFSKYGSTYCGPTAINENEQQRIAIYPNPANNKIAIVGAAEVKHIQVFDCVGRILMEVENNNEIEIAQLSPGIYYIKARLAGNELISHTVIKE